MITEPIFCYPALDDDAYLDFLRAIYEESRHDAGFSCELTPVQTARFAERAVAMRLGILQRVYAGEYFTDSFDVPRLSERIRGSREFIWFWGRSQTVNAWLDAEVNDPATCELGTVSVIDSSDEFGAGMGEICRSGSMTPVPLKPYAVKRIIDFLSGAIPVLHHAFHTLLLVPRVRAAAPGIRGGRSVNTIHRKYIRSRFWGFAPWYVMQGGFLECLEYREVNRSLSDVLRGIDTFSTIYLAHEDEREFVGALFAMNLPAQADAVSFATQPPGAARARFRRVGQASEAIRPYNHLAFELADGGDNSELLVTLDGIDATLQDAACTVVSLDLSLPHTLGIQQALRDRGYRLTCIRPPRSVGADKVPCRGSWARPNPRWRLVAPHYVVRKSPYAHEQRVLQHLRHLLDSWAMSA